MKPISYQSMPSSVNGGHPDLALDRLLNTSKVMYCEKCGFASTDAVAFKKHMNEHMGTRFQCFYCNNVSFSEAELSEHLKQHTSKYPFKCPHCGQGYMRRLCLVKHIDRLHSKNINQGSAKPGMMKSPLVSVSSALTSAPAADPSPPRPFAWVSIPNPTASTVRLGKDEQRAKTLDTSVSNTTSGNAEHVSNLNGHIQHNRALTVSLPEEVSIPAGCLVELVEVKTVNGTKELKLRLISQQENESVIKDTQTTALQNTALGKPLSSTLHPPNTARSMSMGMCTVNRKQSEAKMVNVELPASVPAKISSNLPKTGNKEKNALKRTSSEIINLDCNSVIPNKISKNILSPVREGNGGIRVTQAAPVNHNSHSPTAISSRVGSRLSTTLHPPSIGTSVPQRVMDERKNASTEHAKSIPPRRPSDANNIQEVSAAVKLEPGQSCPKGTASKEVKEVVCLNQQSTLSSHPLRTHVTSSAQVRPPAILVSKDNVAKQPFPLLRTLIKPSSVATPVLSNRTNLKTSVCTQDVRSNSITKQREVSVPESFPVISSVFSLSEQPQEGQGSIQPLVMALRGIVMDKNQSSGSTTQEQLKIQINNDTNQMCKAPTSECSVQTNAKNGFSTHDVLLTEQTSESVKVEEQDVLQPPPLTQNDIHVKEEKRTDGDKCCHIPASKSPPCEETKIAPQVETQVVIDPLSQTDKSQHDVSSKFLTISLKRVQVGVWKKSKKRLKIRLSRYKPRVPVGSLNDCTVFYPMPLKRDQLVKRPGPNQPVVVLNHPKPRASVQRMRADSFADTGASEVVPNCQILKMRLSKVMGQKYEVMGCTVRVFP